MASNIYPGVPNDVTSVVYLSLGDGEAVPMPRSVELAAAAGGAADGVSPEGEVVPPRLRPVTPARTSEGKKRRKSKSNGAMS